MNSDITEDFTKLYFPASAVVFYETREAYRTYACDTYVEYFDIDEAGRPQNAHPLSVREAQRLSQALNTREHKAQAFLRPKGVLPTNVLHFNPAENGSLLWYSQAGEKPLFFSSFLEIPDAKAHVPPLLWLADKGSLRLFALASDRRPDGNAPLYYAPFFNIYRDGKVCMGNVNIRIKASASLEEFMSAWETYFFQSRFSHLIEGHHPVKTNCVALWKQLIDTGEPFPKKQLVKTNLKLKDLII